MSVNKNPHHVPCALQKEETCGNLSRLLAGEQNQTAASAASQLLHALIRVDGLAELIHPLSQGGCAQKMLGKLPNPSWNMFKHLQKVMFPCFLANCELAACTKGWAVDFAKGHVNVASHLSRDAILLNITILSGWYMIWITIPSHGRFMALACSLLDKFLLAIVISSYVFRISPPSLGFIL